MSSFEIDNVFNNALNVCFKTVCIYLLTYFIHSFTKWYIWHECASGFSDDCVWGFFYFLFFINCLFFPPSFLIAVCSIQYCRRVYHVVSHVDWAGLCVVIARWRNDGGIAGEQNKWAMVSSPDGLIAWLEHLGWAAAISLWRVRSVKTRRNSEANFSALMEKQAKCRSCLCVRVENICVRVFNWAVLDEIWKKCTAAIVTNFQYLSTLSHRCDKQGKSRDNWNVWKWKLWLSDWEEMVKNKEKHPFFFLFFLLLYEKLKCNWKLFTED